MLQDAMTSGSSGQSRPVPSGGSPGDPCVHSTGDLDDRHSNGGHVTSSIADIVSESLEETDVDEIIVCFTYTHAHTYTHTYTHTHTHIYTHT